MVPTTAAAAAAVLTFISLCCVSLPSTLGLGLPSRGFERRQWDLVKYMTEKYINDSTFASEYDKLFDGTPTLFDKIGHDHPFPCDKLNSSDSVPTTVHQLRPGDIDVVAAMGDSLTAGRGASGGILGLLVDYRGLSWSDGGDNSYRTTRTIPNILREYNPSLHGYSQGKGKRDCCGSHLNVARSGAVSSEMLEQAEMLVQRMKNDPKVNMTEDWKLITLFIGANDLCAFCDDETKYSVATYKENIQSALDYLHNHVPRAFVNLVDVINPELVRELVKGPLCKTIHFFVCDCVVLGSAESMVKLRELRQGYLAAVQDLASSGRYDTRDDFTVVSQPFYDNTVVPRTDDGAVDYSYFASDCFHQSKKGQEAAARALWNSMFEPVGSKALDWTKYETLLCPSETQPFLFTSQNSQVKG